MCAVTGVYGMEGYQYWADGSRVGRGTITSMSCDLLTNGYQPISESIVDQGGAQITKVAINEAGLPVWDHTDVLQRLILTVPRYSLMKMQQAPGPLRTGSQDAMPPPVPKLPPPPLSDGEPERVKKSIVVACALGLTLFTLSVGAYTRSEVFCILACFCLIAIMLILRVADAERVLFKRQARQRIWIMPSLLRLVFILISLYLAPGLGRHISDYLFVREVQMFESSVSGFKSGKSSCKAVFTEDSV